MHQCRGARQAGEGGSGRTRVQRVDREPEHQRAQQHLRPLRKRVPSIDEAFIGLAPRQRVDNDHSRRPRRGPPIRRDVRDPRGGSTREQDRAVEIAVDKLVGALGRPPQPGKLIDQLDRPLPVRAGRCRAGGRGYRLQRPIFPGGTVGGDEDVDVGPRRGGSPESENTRPFQACRWLSCSRTAADTTSSCRGSELAGHESVCSPTGHHVTSIGRADRPGQSNTVDEQRLAHPGRPGGPGVLGAPSTAPLHRTASRPPTQRPGVSAPHRSGRTPTARAPAAGRHSRRLGLQTGPAKSRD